jgi:hypothetical protein
VVALGGGGDAQQHQHLALAAAFTRMGVEGDGGSALASSLAPLVGSYGARLPGRGMTLATSFREPSCLPVPAAIAEEGVGLDDNSDEEWEARRARDVGGARRRAGCGAGGAAGGGAAGGPRRGGVGGGDEQEDSSDDEAPGGGGAAGGGELEEEGGVFGGGHF